jgi:endonuclease-3
MSPERVPKADVAAPRPTAALKQRTQAILDILEKTHPDAHCALEYQNAFQLTVATILSAQCTDERVNMVTPALFRRYPKPADLAGADMEELEGIIKTTGFYRAKAKSLVGCARGLMAEHGGEVPRSMAAMVELPGVGRKTSNVVLGHAYGMNEGIAVDTHVLRVSNRLAIARGDDPVDVEAQLMRTVPRERWTRFTDLVIFHGRRICQARKPACGVCPVFALCRFPLKQAYADDPATAPKPTPRKRSRRA